MIAIASLKPSYRNIMVADGIAKKKNEAPSKKHLTVLSNPSAANLTQSHIALPWNFVVMTNYVEITPRNYN
jgi:hypothetical protein